MPRTVHSLPVIPAVAALQAPAAGGTGGSPGVARSRAPTQAPAGGFAFFRVFLGWTLAIVLVYLGLVSVIDPLRHFRGHWFPQTVPVPVGEKLPLFDRYQEAAPVTGLILGSSRSMILPPELLDGLTGLRFFNAGVFGGLAEDDLAVYRLLVERGARPAILLIGIDDFSLNDFQPVRDETRSNYALARQISPAANGPIGHFLHVARLYHESMSPDMFVAMCRAIGQRISPSEPINFFHPDGRLSYSRRDRQIESRNYDLEREIRLDFNYVAILRETWFLSPRRTRYLEALLSEARKRHTRMRMFLPPYHPELLSAMRNDPVAWRHHSMALEYYRSLEGRFGVRLADYTDETSFGGAPEAWYDGVHYNLDNAVKLIRQSVRDGI